MYVNTYSFHSVHFSHAADSAYKNRAFRRDFNEISPQITVRSPRDLSSRTVSSKGATAFTITV